MQYEPPYTLQEIRDRYPADVYDELSKCPIHRWRAVTGIELVHREPDLKELKRIWQNWNLMSNEEKKISDQKSVELFGVDNETHYYQLLDDYEDENDLSLEESFKLADFNLRFKVF